MTMNKIELKAYLEKDNKSGYKTKEKHLKNTYPEIYDQIIKNCIENISYKEKLFLYINNLNSVPKCPTCGSANNYLGKLNKGYTSHCSIKCSNNDPIIKDKISKKNIITQNKEKTKKLIIDRNLKKYGVNHPMQLKNFKEKTKKTNLEKYGVVHHLKLKSQQKKQTDTNLKKYGVQHISQVNVIKNKIKETNLNRYNVENPFQFEEFKEKTKKTNLEKYGVEYISQNNEIREKIKQTNIEKYGVENYSQTNEYLIKSKERNLKKYGVDNIFKSKEFIKNQIINKEKLFLLKYSKYLKININDILINKDKNLITIKNYCKNHLDGFEITKSLIYDRLITQKIKDICTKCNPISEQSSIKENEIKDFLKNELNLNIIENTKKIIKPLELDIYLPDYNLAIEFDGLYHHSEVFKDKNYHLNKTNECEKQNIQLLHIFEDEWINKSEIVKSIITSKLGLIDNKIFARKTIIKEVSSLESRKFLDKNHIQGFVGSKVKLGLYYNNELVSLMLFDKLRKGLGNYDNNSNYWILNRFCNKINNLVIGGASKLFKYFIKMYKPEKIVTYADRRYSNGELYKNLKFNEIHKSKPDYFYISGMKRYHRFNYRKSLLKEKIKNYNENLTERENILTNKIYKIYDCGKIRYEFDINMS